MRDPFRPNSNSQLVREAQIAFVVIALLLCVLVYVAFHRMTGREMHFRQMAEGVPPAQHIGDTRYLAETMDVEEKVVDKTVDVHRHIMGSQLATSQEIPKRVETRSPSVVKTLPIEEAAVAATAQPAPASAVAQTNFTESVASHPRKTDLTKSTATTTTKDDAFTVGAPDRSTPEIRSDFGAGSIRELPSFDDATKASRDFDPVLKPVPDSKAGFKAAPTKPKQLAPAAKPAPRRQNLQPLRSSTFNPEAQKLQPPKAKIAAAKPLQSFPLVRSGNFQSPNSPSPGKTASEFAAIAKPTSPKVIPQLETQAESNQQYKTKTGDSLWSIAAEHYGDGRFFRALYEHNLTKIAAADQLPAGTALEIPELDQLLRRYPELCPADKIRTARAVNNDARSTDGEGGVSDYNAYETRMNDRYHITQSGDTLFGVARQRLGQASRYLEIFELNRFRIPENVDHLTPLPTGLRLVLPE